MAKKNAGGKGERKSKNKTREDLTERMTPGEERRNKFRAVKELEYKNERQAEFGLSIKSNIITVGLGPAGTGKTYIPTILAAQDLEAGRIKRLVVTRPNVESGTSMGARPGTVNEKFEPFFAPFRCILNGYFGESYLKYLLDEGTVQIAPIELIKGHTFDDCFMIVDETQNTTPEQMKLILTRIGQRCTVVINGDTDQKDIRELSGLEDILDLLPGMTQFNVVRFEEEHIVRSGIVKDILLRYRDRARARQAAAGIHLVVNNDAQETPTTQCSSADVAGSQG